jgi:hypothetical protein
MTIETYGLPEERYLEIFKEKVEFICKAIRIVDEVTQDYNIKLKPELFWNLFQESLYAADDACRVHQKQHAPEALEARSYETLSYPTTAKVFDEVQKLEELMNQFIEQNKNTLLATDRASNFINELKE